MSQQNSNCLPVSHPQNNLKAYFFTMRVANIRADEFIARKCGVVFADTKDNAIEIAWNRYGNDFSCELDVWEIPDEGTFFTVYRSEI